MGKTILKTCISELPLNLVFADILIFCTHYFFMFSPLSISAHNAPWYYCATHWRINESLSLKKEKLEDLNLKPCEGRCPTRWEGKCQLRETALQSGEVSASNLVETYFALRLNNIRFEREKEGVWILDNPQPLPGAGLDHLLDGLPEDPCLPRGRSGQQQRLLGLARLSPKITQIVMVIT